MEETNMTLVAAMLVVGLLVGAGVGYFMAPVEVIDEPTQTPQQEIIHSYEPSLVSWLALLFSLLSLSGVGVIAYIIVGSKQ